MRHYTGYDVTDKKLILTWFFDVAAIVSGVASIVIGQVGRCLQVDNVICTITGTGHGFWPRWANIFGENSALKPAAHVK